MAYVSPFMHEVSQHKSYIQNKVHQVIKNFVSNQQIGKALDVGVRNPLTSFLEETFDVQIDNTAIDLDIEPLTGSYDTVFCFEVLEHLFNPLHMMLEIHKVLKSDGKLFLSTPKCKPHFLWFEHHFHEFHPRELYHLAERAGFEIVRFESCRIHPVWKGFTGIRPFLRLLFQRKLMLELRKVKQ